jgi:hypothetical protein
MLSKQNSLASSEEYKLLAVLSQFLVETRHCCNQYFTLMISFVLQYATPELFRKKKLQYLNLSQMSTDFEPGMSRL